MKNSDKPAFPSNIIDDGFTSDSSGQITGLKKSKSTGLTKREYFAGLILQGLLSSMSVNMSKEYVLKGSEIVVANALITTDNLLKQLESK